MPRASIRRVALAATLAGALTGYLASPAAVGAAARTPAPRAPATGAAGHGSVLLINGDHALPGAAAGGGPAPVLRVPGGRGPASSVLTVRAGTRTLMLPTAALPFLGRGLDLSLFELSALSHAEHDGRLPVTLRFRGAPHPVPGITVTQRGAGTEQGYLTASSAGTFGAAIARQMLADHPRDSYGRDGVFAGGLSISLTGAPAARPAAASFPMHTLTVRGTNLAGRPDTGDEVTVWNVTNFGEFGDLDENFSAFYHGSAAFSVPAGTYWAFAMFLGSGGSARLDVLPQFTVGRDTTVTARAAAADSKVEFVTPRPAHDTGATTFALVRGGAHGGVSWFFGGPASLWVNPVRRPPTAGYLYSATSTQLVSPAGPGTPYTYALDFPAPPGTIEPQHFVVRPRDLAAVKERFYQDAPQQGGWLTSGGTPRQLHTVGFSGTSTTLRLPGAQTLYLSARPATLWQTNTFIAGISAGQTNAWRLYHGGQQLSETWNAYPLHPAPNVSRPGSVFPALPSASRAGNKLLVDVTPFSDSTFGHTGTGFNDNGGPSSGTAGSYALYQDGAKIAGGKAQQSFSGDLLAEAPVSTHRSRIRFVLTASRKGKAPNLSSASRDVWTWPSRPDPAATVPAPWYCGASRAGHQVVYDRHCAIQDMMMLRYRVAGLTPLGTARPGTQALGITVGHLQQIAPFPVTSAGAQVSYDAGTTWRPVTLSQAGSSGRFRASYRAPAGAAVSLRITARDTLGATITETIVGAYRTSG